jgi:hypothetical protein
MKQVRRLKLWILVFVALLWGCGEVPSESRDAEIRPKDETTQTPDTTVTTPPPMGRSIALGAERNAVLVQELKKRNASYWSISYHDHEFIAWPPESDEVADAVLQAIDVNPQGVLEMKKMREAADAEARDRTSPSR